MLEKIFKKAILVIFILVAMYRVTVFPQADEYNSENNDDQKDINYYQVSDAGNNSIPEDELGNSSLETFPNPFSIVSLIKFELVKTANIRMTITDMEGKVIDTLAEGELEKGVHHLFFKAPEFLPEGNYKCRLEVFSDSGNKCNLSERIMTHTNESISIYKR